ncbi:MAG: D-3-phosphoglycerate dehydrogenase / 2-oxoglutarate reductase [Clostridiales bacterium]|jgi:D-3-phosphoglycerate dehydrogenase|nr:D-3-phosphoglycerate dehydrogenase / 2-oxoglutarate reductase [Clostridiales bacterium]MDN5283716.1 D-3-phosphoglycerate dehydrogenase / 2-oxoglutarate reductase [Candidatus Ozemobacter sp.]
MTKKILVATEKPFAPDAISQMKKVIADKSDYAIELLEKYTEVSQFKDAVKDADALIIRSDKATREVMDAAQKLKIIVRAGAGYDNIDLAAASEKNIVAMNTPGQNSNAVAELALGMMVYMARCKFNGKSGSELLGKKIGIHAYGNVGKAVARIAKGFGMEVYAFDPFVAADKIEADGVKVVGSVEELYRTCHYVSLHIPANDKTKKSINFDLLNSMPKGAVLVNTARKEVICEESMKKILAARNDFKYVSDIAPDCAEELNKDFADRVYFTPKKMGAQTEEANINAGVAAVEQIVAYFENGDTTFQVNK